MRATFVVGAMFALSFRGFAQTGGQVTGVVIDPSGSVIVGAAVTITNSPDKPRTQGDHEQRRLLLLSGAAARRLQRESGDGGFKDEVREGVELQVEQIARIDFRLQIGAASQTVEVSGGAPLLNTERATVGMI
jgi:hypothetical protein